METRLWGALPPVRGAVSRLSEYSAPDDAARLARRLGVPVEAIVKLDANENPYGCSPRVAAALAAFSGYHWYPDPLQEAIRPLVARYVGVEPESVILGNGADELIDLIMRAYLDPGDEVVDLQPSFGMYAFNAQHYDARLRVVSRDSAFEFDLPGTISAVSPRTRLIFVASPNNPTGNLAPREAVERLLETGCVVVLDEAYAEFAGQSLAPLVAERPNLVVLRTFSKWAGLAGLRIGYGVFPEGVAHYLWKLKPPFSVNLAAIEAARVSLEDVDYLMGNVRLIRAERDRLLGLLGQVDWLRPFPSQANFILCQLIDRDALEVKTQLAEMGILVRHYRTELLNNYLRISVGRPRDTEALMEALGKVGGVSP